MTINNPQSYMDGIWDWAILKSSLGGKIQPTDLDGFVERRGQFLVLETKQPGALIKTGQRLTFEALCRLPQFTVMVIWGTKDQPQSITVMRGNQTKHYNRADLALLQQLVRRWYIWADRRQYINPRGN